MLTDNILQFINNENRFRVTIEVDTDFECILKHVSNCFRNPEKCFTVIKDFHIPMSSCIYFVKHNCIPEYIKNQLPSEPPPHTHIKV